MGANLVLRLIIFTTVSKLCVGTAGHGKRISRFRVLRKHKHIMECAAFILSDKNDNIGGRVSDKTDVCEGLPYSWDWNQSTEAEYSYFREISMQRYFVPPIEVREDGYSKAIPGTFDTGARLELYVTMFEENTDDIYFTITDASNSSRGFQLWLSFSSRWISFKELPDELNLNGDKFGFPVSSLQSTNQVKIAFEAQKKYMQVSVDGIDRTKEPKNVRIDSLKHVAIRTSEIRDQHALFLHRFEFIEA